MSVDQRNLLALVQDEFNQKMSRLPKGLANDIASILGRVEMYQRYPASQKQATWILNRIQNYLRTIISEGGEGRKEMVAAIQAERTQFMPDTVGKAPGLPSLNQPNQGVTVNVNGQAQKPAKKGIGGILQNMRLP